MISVEVPKIVETRTVQKWGNGLGILLPKSMIDLFIPEYKLEDLLAGFEEYQNHFEWEEIPLVGEEL